MGRFRTPSPIWQGLNLQPVHEFEAVGGGGVVAHAVAHHGHLQAPFMVMAGDLFDELDGGVDDETQLGSVNCFNELACLGL